MAYRSHTMLAIAALLGIGAAYGENLHDRQTFSIKCVPRHSLKHWQQVCLCTCLHQQLGQLRLLYKPPYAIYSMQVMAVD